jgi:hypothetical protein
VRVSSVVNARHWHCDGIAVYMVDIACVEAIGL